MSLSRVPARQFVVPLALPDETTLAPAPVRPVMNRTQTQSVYPLVGSYTPLSRAAAVHREGERAGSSVGTAARGAVLRSGGAVPVWLWLCPSLRDLARKAVASVKFSLCANRVVSHRLARALDSFVLWPIS